MINPKAEALNPKQAINLKLQTPNASNLKLNISNLSFDFAQDGELVEPFRVSIFGFRILSTRRERV